jgi:hypothetical protein
MIRPTGVDMPDGMPAATAIPTQRSRFRTHRACLSLRDSTQLAICHASDGGRAAFYPQTHGRSSQIWRFPSVIRPVSSTPVLLGTPYFHLRTSGFTSVVPTNED